MITESFSVQLLSPCQITQLTTTQTIADITFNFGSPAVLVPFAEFDDSEAMCYGMPGLCGVVYSINMPADASAYGVTVIPGSPATGVLPQIQV